MTTNTSGAAAAVALNAANAIIHALVVKGMLTGPQAAGVLTGIAEETRKDGFGPAGDDLADWLDEAAKAYQ
jgi:hypothetical protein